MPKEFSKNVNIITAVLSMLWLVQISEYYVAISNVLQHVLNVHKSAPSGLDLCL